MAEKIIPRIKTRAELIEEIKAAGLSIIHNAESILGDETYFLNTIVSFKVERSKDSISTVHVHREFIPEVTLEGPIQDVKNEIDKKEVKKNGKQKAANSTTRKTTKRK